MAARSPRVALVLSGGAKRGLGHIGVLEVLHPLLAALQERQELMLVTCSAGSIAGALYLDRLDPGYAKEATLEMASHKLYQLLGVPSIWRGMRGGGFFSLKRIEKFLSKKLSAKKFADLAAPLYALTANLHTGTPALLSSGPLTPAICASCAIPFFFQPITIEGQDYVDGSIFAVTPVLQAKQLGAETIIAVSLQEVVQPITGTRIINSGMRSLKMLDLGRLHIDLEQADVVIDLKFNEEGHFLINRKGALRLYETGKEAALALLPTVEKKLQKYLASASGE